MLVVELDPEILFSCVCTLGLLYTRSSTLGFGAATRKGGSRVVPPRNGGLRVEPPRNLFGMWVGQQFGGPMVLD